MAQSIFSTNVSYAPGGGGALTQSFNVTASYTAINAGTLDVPIGTSVTAALDIPFGSVGGARGFVLRNNTPVDLKVYLNGGTVTATGTEPVLQLPHGGFVIYASPVDASGTDESPVRPLGAVRVYLKVPLPAGQSGTIDYITLGA